jgi:hypothetical protein
MENSCPKDGEDGKAGAEKQAQPATTRKLLF